MNGVEVTELHTQDGWDWPNGVSDERWPVESDAGPSRTALATYSRRVEQATPLSAAVLRDRVTAHSAS